MRGDGVAWLFAVAALLAGGCARAPAPDVGPQMATVSADAAPGLSAVRAEGVAPGRSGTDFEAEQWRLAMDTALHQHLQRLWRGGDAQGRLAAVMLAQEDAQMQARLVELWSQYPDDVQVAWQMAVACRGGKPDCDTEAALLRLQQVDPDNAATWLLLMEDAYSRGDAAAAAAFLALAAQAPHHTTHYVETAALLWQAVRDLPVPQRSEALAEAQRRSLRLPRPPSDDDWRAYHMAGAASATPIPPYSALAAQCWRKGGAGRPSPDCEPVLKRLAASRSMLERSIGLDALVRASAGTPAGAHWREQLRRFRWLMAEGYEIAPSDSAFLRSMWEQGEVGALQALLASSGLAEPPPDWLPADPLNRALVTTGRPPPET